MKLTTHPTKNPTIVKKRAANSANPMADTIAYIRPNMTIVTPNMNSISFTLNLQLQTILSRRRVTTKDTIDIAKPYKLTKSIADVRAMLVTV